MTDEEKKAVDYWKNYMEILHWNTQLASEHYMKVLLDLIEKQQIELNSLKEIEYKYNKALEDLVKQEKNYETIINLLEKRDNRIKELESDKEIKNKIIDRMAEYINKLYIDEDICTKNIINPELCNEQYSNCKECIKQYFENLAKESGEIDE